MASFFSSSPDTRLPSWSSPDSINQSRDSLDTWWAKVEDGVVRTRLFSLDSEASSTLPVEPAEEDVSMAASFSTEENADQCHICDAVLGKRRLKPRHHCKFCNRTVCSDCSPNNVQLGLGMPTQRVCTPCVSKAFKAHESKAKIAAELKWFVEQLRDLVGSILGDEKVFDVKPSLSWTRDGDPDQFVKFSEAAICLLTDAVSHHHELRHDVHRYNLDILAAKEQSALELERRMQLEDEIGCIKNAGFQLGKHIHSLTNGDTPEVTSADDTEPVLADASAAEVLQMCDAACISFTATCNELTKLKSKVQDLESKLADTQQSQEQLHLSAQHELDEERVAGQELKDQFVKVCDAWFQLSSDIHSMANDNVLSAFPTSTAQEGHGLGTSALVSFAIARSELSEIKSRIQISLVKLHHEQQGRQQFIIQVNDVESELIQERQAREELATKLSEVCIEINNASSQLSLQIHPVTNPKDSVPLPAENWLDVGQLCDNALATFRNACSESSNIKSHIESIEAELADERQARKQADKRCNVIQFEQMQSSEELLLKLTQQLVARLHVGCCSWWNGLRPQTLLILILHFLVLCRASHSKGSLCWRMPALPTIRHFYCIGMSCKMQAYVNSWADLVKSRCISALRGRDRQLQFTV